VFFGWVAASGELLQFCELREKDETESGRVYSYRKSNKLKIGRSDGDDMMYSNHWNNAITHG